MSTHRQLVGRTSYIMHIVASLSITLWLGFAANSSAVTSANFFKPAPNPAAQLDPNGIYPLGQQFGFGLYTVVGNSKVDPTTSNMHRVATNGFTLAGPYYDNSWGNFSNIYAAAEEGLRFTFQIRPPESLFGVSVDNRPAALDKLTDAQMAASVREQVTAVLSDPIANQSVARWSLGLDELRYWKNSEMRYLKVASQTLRAVEAERGAPHRPFWMYEPNHRNAAGLQLTGVHQDSVTKGVYLTSQARGPQRSAYAMWSISQIVSAAKNLKTLPQAVLQLSQDFSDPKTGKNPAEIRRVLRHDAYLALTMGVKGLNVWSMYEDRPNLTTHNEQFLAYASVAEDLTGALDLQKVFLFGQQRTDLGISITQGLKQVKYTDSSGESFSFPTLHYFNAAVGADRYLFLVNSTEQIMDVKITGLPSRYLLDDLFAGITKEIRNSTLTWRLETLGVSALRFRQLGVATVAPVPEPSAAISATFAFLSAAVMRRRRTNRLLP